MVSKTIRIETMPATNRRLAQWRVKWLIEHSTRINFCGVLTVLCSEIRHYAKPQNVISHFKATENERFDLKFCKFEKYLRLINMFNTIEIDRSNLTIMGVKFSDLKTLESTANALGSNMFEGYKPTPKGIEIIRDYVTGKISLAELVAFAKQKAYV